MSIFDFPRINFSGKTWFNPGTANNNSLGPGTELAYTSNSEDVMPVRPTAGMSDAEIVTWLQSTQTIPGMGTVLNAQWNYYGDQSFRFLDTTVSSIAMGYGQLVTSAEDDPLIGAAVSPTRGIMCDNNPEGFNTTQFFTEAIELRAPGVLAPTGTFVSRKPSRASTIRGLNWDRNLTFHTDLQNTSGGAGGASGTFQCTIEIHPEDLEPVDAPVGSELEVLLHKLVPGQVRSPALEALLALFKGANPPKGLLVRYNFYLTVPQIDDVTLSASFLQGVYTENPAIGRVLGSIVPWYADETRATTMGRFIGKAGTFYNKSSSRPYYLAGMVARVDRAAKLIQLDAIDTFPEAGAAGEKYGLGVVALGLREATAPNTDPAANTAPVTVIGVLTNDQATYVATGGLHEVSYAGLSPELQAGLEDTEHHAYELVLQTTGTPGVTWPEGPMVLLYEQEFMVEPTSKCNYVDQLPPGESWTGERMQNELIHLPEALSGFTRLAVWRRGVPFRGTVKATVEQWQITPTGSNDPSEKNVYLWPQPLVRHDIEITDGSTYAMVPAGGSGVRMYRFLPNGHFPRTLTPQQLDWGLTDEFFCTQRVLPYEDFSGITDEALDFSVIYEKVFRYYFVLMPAMNKRLDLSDASIWRSPTAARYILRTTDLGLWETYDFMPRTRDLSRSRRELLKRFCQTILKGAR